MKLFGRAGRARQNALAARASPGRAELSALHETTLALLDQQSPEELLETIVDRAGKLVGSADGYVDLLEQPKTPRQRSG